ncbi:hypothetical protein [Tissierella praeacuta]|uniref:lysine 5,6-aminomutase reactivase subunit KamB n=1 Tax=Tissierella praeacuta TaxID=43131 RepID=UPI003340F60D
MLELINGKYKTISIVGMSKNSGKTVALNHLIGEAIDEGIPIGITSIGRDGESLDIVTETEKPRIFLEEGALIATATGMLELGDANIEILKVTEYRTPLGEIIIGRVRDGGYVQIAGPQLLSEIKAVSDIMLNLGAKFVIIDGALDRLSQAAPAISEATVLSTGAVLSRDMNKVMEETIHVAKTLGLPAIEDNEVREIIRKLIYNNQIAVIDENNQVDIIPLKTALNGGVIIGDHLKDNSKYLVIPGSLVKNTIEDLTRSTRKYKNIEIVITDGTKIFIGPKDWLKFMRQGVVVKVLDKINLVGITLNPYAPAGYYFEPVEFLSKMKSHISQIPVMDLILGGE